MFKCLMVRLGFYKLVKVWACKWFGLNPVPLELIVTKTFLYVLEMRHMLKQKRKCALSVFVYK